MKIMPIVYVTDLERAASFYRALGFEGAVAGRGGMWAELKMEGASLGLHYIDRLPDKQVGRVELALVADNPLEELAAHLQASGIALEREISDEAFGRSLQVRDPDGLVIQINEHDHTLYT